MSKIHQNLQIIGKQIETLCRKHRRPHEQVSLLAVSKRHSEDSIRDAYSVGQRAFGENYVQEMVRKADALKELAGIEWHFIGPLQSNKTRDVARVASWVHTVDRIKIAQRLHDQRPSSLAPLSLCLQVNVSKEDSKSGVQPEALPELVTAISELPQLALRGLMTIPAATRSFDEQRAAFAILRESLEKLQVDNHSLDTLSMGMSGDIEAAIAEGSTMLRVGTAIFGQRN